ncbi:MAG: TonB-dependent receptor [Gammaproteobacteria bacterium]|nr:MAG: TonB-dependent receptor [Gammaproteobacteria bacterium]
MTIAQKNAMTLALPICVAMALGTAHAQTEQQSRSVQAVEEIVVSAQRRVEPLQSTPVTVTALSEDVLEVRQVTNVIDIAAQVPNLRIDAVTGVANAAKIFLRGVGEDQSGPNTDNAIGLYVDDVYYPRTLGALFDFLDVERIEVLRGPQGTLYGRNTPGGAVKIITRRPGEELTGRADITVGNYGRRQFRGALSGPLSDTVGASIALLKNERDGTSFSTTLNRDVNRRDVEAIRGAFSFTPNDALDVVLRYDWMNDETESFLPTSILGGFPDDLLVTAAGEDPEARLIGRGLSLNASYDFGDFSLQSITAWRSLDQRAFLDNDGRAPRVLAFDFDARQSQFSQELLFDAQWDRLRLLAGGYFFREDNTYDTVTYIFATVRPGEFGQDTRSVALFANAGYEITDKLTISAGARWTRDKKEFFDAYPTLNALFEAENSWTAFTPRVTLDYQLTGGALLYASYAEGFKAGGFNRSINQIVAETPFNEEKVKTWEAGVKADLFERRVRVNAAVFYNDYQDLQLSAFDPETNISRRFNAAQATTKGVELELSAVPLDGLQTFLTVGYLNAGYDEFFDLVGGELADVSDRKLKGAPRWTVAGGASYLFPQTDIGDFRFSVDFNSRTETFQNVSNTPVVATPTVTLWNAQLSWRSPDQRWTATLGAKNLFDKEYFGAALFIANLAEVVYPAEPRTWTLGLRYDF